MVGLVVQHDDILHPHQLGHNPLKHLAFGFKRLKLFAAPSFNGGARAFGDVHTLAQFEGVVVGDDDLGMIDITEHVGRCDLAMAVITFQVIGKKDTQAVADRDSRSHDQETAREGLAVAMSRGVHRLPGDQHRHDGRLPRAGRKFERQTHQLGIGLFVRALEMVPELGATSAQLRRNLGQPDCGLNGLDLTEKWLDAFEIVVSPMLQKPCRLRGDEPLIGIGERAP